MNQPAEATAGTEPEKKEGAFISSLKRNNKQIREDRAQAIGENAHLIYKRAVEDLEVEIKQMERERENMLDMSPDSATSLKLASDFDAKAFVEKDLELGRRIRDKQILLDEVAKVRFAHLFG